MALTAVRFGFHFRQTKGHIYGELIQTVKVPRKF